MCPLTVPGLSTSEVHKEYMATKLGENVLLLGESMEETSQIMTTVLAGRTRVEDVIAAAIVEQRGHIPSVIFQPTHIVLSSYRN